jgi:hypothetical protein
VIFIIPVIALADVENDNDMTSFSNPNNWLSDFTYKVAPECSLRFCWLANSFNLDELLADLLICNNSSAGLDEIKFNLLKNLPEVGKHTLLEIFNEVLSTGNFSGVWREKKVVSILKRALTAPLASYCSHKMV